MTTIMIDLARTTQFQHVLCECVGPRFWSMVFRSQDWLGPVAWDASAVPAGECVGDGAKQRPVVIDERWSLMLAVARLMSRWWRRTDDLAWSTPTSEFCAPTGTQSGLNGGQLNRESTSCALVMLVNPNNICVCQIFDRTETFVSDP